MKSKMKCSTLWLPCLLLACLVSSGVGIPAAANPKRKSQNLLSDNIGEASNGGPHQGDLIPIPDNLLKKPAPKKVAGKKNSNVSL
jgi:hypothetical protein